MVEAKEAHQLGLANRLVKDETAYGTAVNLAREMVRFPQECLKADRASAYHAVFASKGIEDALQFEADNGAHIINKASHLFKFITEQAFPN